jgi:hypothetical protein
MNSCLKIAQAGAKCKQQRRHFGLGDHLAFQSNISMFGNQ